MDDFQFIAEKTCRRELGKLNDVAFALVNATGGDPAQAEALLADFIDLVFEGGVLQMWRYRLLLAAIRDGL